MCGLGYHEERRARQGRGRCALSSPTAMPRATTDHHPATHRGPRRPPPTPARWPTGRMIPRDQDEVLVALGERRVKLTNLRKLFWPALGITKGDLIRYYVDLAPVLLPHLRDRAMVMRRYPDGAGGKSFFMKRAPTPRPDWLATCAIEHASGNVIDFPMIQDLAALLWVVNLGCIDLNQWYARCDDVDRPDYLHFDLDPGTATFTQVLKTALIVHEALRGLGMPDYVKTTGSKGLHVYVPIVRGPTQKDVWTAAKTIALQLARAHPRLMTAEYKVALRRRHLDASQDHRACPGRIRRQLIEERAGLMVPAGESAAPLSKPISKTPSSTKSRETPSASALSYVYEYRAMISRMGSLSPGAFASCFHDRDQLPRRSHGNAARGSRPDHPATRDRVRGRRHVGHPILEAGDREPQRYRTQDVRVR